MWKPIFTDTFKLATVDAATIQTINSVLLDDGTGTYHVFMKNIGMIVECRREASSARDDE